MGTKQAYHYDVSLTEVYRLTLSRPMTEEEEADLRETESFPEGSVWKLVDTNTDVKEVQ